MEHSFPFPFLLNRAGPVPQDLKVHKGTALWCFGTTTLYHE